MGALLHGDPLRHEITLAHEQVVLPTDPPRSAPLLATDLALIRRMIDSGHAQDAADLGVSRAAEEGYPGLQWTDPLVPSATLVIETDSAVPTDYRRYVDMELDVVSVHWKDGARTASIETFVSRADHVMIARLAGAARGASIRLAAPGNVMTTMSGVKGGNAERVQFNSGSEDGMQWLAMRFVANWPLNVLGSNTVLRVLHEDAEAKTIAVALDVADSSASNDSVDGGARLRALETDYEQLLREHAAHLRRKVKMTRLSLHVQSDGRAVEDLLADQSPDAKKNLIETQYRAAQRLIADSTGTLPPTLQGVWSGSFDPAWSSDYTMNGNVQSGSISSMLGTGNPAQLRTYLDMLEGFAEDFRDNARRLFGTEGFVLPSRCSPTHGACTHFDAKHCHEYWTAGGAWSALFFLDYVWHTADLDYLRSSAYPFAREVERFYEGFLTRDDDDRIVFSPSYSPENRSPTFDSQACRNATMDRAVLDRLLHGLIRSSQLTGIDQELEPRRREWLNALPPYRIAPDGTLAEWLDDGVIERVGHRTASHLLGTWFEPDGRFHAELREPARNLIRAKLSWRASGGNREEMAYGLVQLGLAAAVIGDPGLALECVDRMSRLYFLPSLSTTHDVGSIFNVDIAGGFPAVINAMLLNSTVDSITLLPAIPSQWASGHLDGLNLRGGVVVDRLEWTPSTIRMVARTTPGARRLRAGTPIRVIAPAGWVLASLHETTPTNVVDVDPADGDFIDLEAHPEDPRA
ncbi:glycoside hydrolase N-terminal domain-containing protein [Microbacterium sp. ET2]|uniref:glycosyl hydrolase family 95 catalytic domain-containing protein n=1 Tax=Microbacterium albipurpureum TaxID=3050384 RepID=UPI00259D2C59|nr:glycoside hydrolase N-terminal domain-containing protein [Microbacterium sp. ET2 (Ac-2212)]WJL97007.1 glycoside hydrolase N-terminal domain-containing protein [Microbacterium sp. ET2 (Ac-2212)]